MVITTLDDQENVSGVKIVPRNLVHQGEKKELWVALVPHIFLLPFIFLMSDINCCFFAFILISVVRVKLDFGEYYLCCIYSGFVNNSLTFQYFGQRLHLYVLIYTPWTTYQHLFTPQTDSKYEDLCVAKFINISRLRNGQERL